MIQRDDPRFEDLRIALEDGLESRLIRLSRSGLSDQDAIDESYRLMKSALVASDVDVWRQELNTKRCLPATHLFSLPDFLELFGEENARRRELGTQLVRIVKLGRTLGAIRLIVGGSFATAKSEPNDLDAAMLVPPEFFRRMEPDARELWCLSMLNENRDRLVQLFLERSEESWWGWFRLFSQNPTPCPLYRGVAEIRL